MFSSSSRGVLVPCFFACLLAACGGGEDAAAPPAAVGGPAPAPPAPGPAPAPANNPPTISGSPPAQVTVGAAYVFQPQASDPDGDALSFTVQNKPGWALFNTSTGRLSGTPGIADVGAQTGVAIAVSDGTATTSLSTFTLTVVAASGSSTLAARYPGDVGIATDADVVFHDDFEQTNAAATIARYDDVTNTAGIALVADKAAASRGAKALQLTSGASADTAHVFKSLGNGYDELYVRYYTKYSGSGPWSHSGLWMGGNNPVIGFPSPNAGNKPAGNDRFSMGLEPVTAGSNALLDLYTYWMKMHSWRANPTGAPGDYYGNTIVNSDTLRVQSGAWVCFEIHLKLNPDPASGLDAVLELWRDDTLVRRYDNTGPLGYWVADKFCPDDSASSECAPFRPSNPALAPLDQQWRSSAALKISYIWPQHYNTSGTNSSILFDDLVVARSRVGCIR
jgi:hypothetical protein